MIMLWNISKSNKALGIDKGLVPNDFECPKDCCNQCDICLKLCNSNKVKTEDSKTEVCKNGCNN